MILASLLFFAVGTAPLGELRNSDTVVTNVQELTESVNYWQSYWAGDDVRLTVTNYFGALDIPALYLEYKQDGNFSKVWDERTRWDDFYTNHFAMVTNSLNFITNNFADRAFGLYDSATGNYSPDGLLQLSQEQIMIGGGMSWQKTVTAKGTVWVLTANDPTLASAVATNGFLRIDDADGNPIYEVVKGDRREAGAQASAVSAGGNSLTITYNVETDDGNHPTLYVSRDFTGEPWTTSPGYATVSWSGSNGAWIATVTPTGAEPQMFARATVMVGGETYIKNTAPISVHGGILCTDGIHKVRPVYNNGTITWEVVQ